MWICVLIKYFRLLRFWRPLKAIKNNLLFPSRDVDMHFNKVFWIAEILEVIKSF